MTRSQKPSAPNNRARGARFESLLVCRAAVCGMRALKNELSFRYLRGGKIRPVRADLDFRILGGDGRVAFIDCKCFDAVGFTYSQIDRNQLMRALVYEQFGVTAGFVVWLEKMDQVVFYSGRTLAQRGARARFVASDGVLLGKGLTFDLINLFPKMQSIEVAAPHATAPLVSRL